MDTADRIFDLLDKAGIEQKSFAEAIGTTDKVVSKWRTQGLKSYRKYLPQIANVLNTSVGYLLTGEVEYKKDAPAIISDEGDALDEELISRLCRLTPEELARVDAFVQGLLASH